jgi:ubiquinone/menaquinone biosynthesis C-methylase UbiE
MSWWQLPRVPEPEEMDEAHQVESYSSAAAERHLDAIDNTFVDHLMRLLPRDAGTAEDLAIDIGTGPAQIPIKILARLPRLRIMGVDRSGNMLRRARRDAEQAGVSQRLGLLRADGLSLPFADGAFSIVMCNSMLHHARDPMLLLREIVRVAGPGAAILLRDLRRPSRPLLAWHLWRHGRRYSGEMRRLFEASVQAAYTLEELEMLLAAAAANHAKVFRYRGAHLGIERPRAPEQRT